MKPSQNQTSFVSFNWDLSEHLMKYKVAFANYDTDHDGYLMNDQARDILLQTRLDPSDLMAIWELADRPPDGKLDVQEFLIAIGLALARKQGQPIPQSVPPALLAAVQRVVFASSTPPSNVIATTPLPNTSTLVTPTVSPTVSTIPSTTLPSAVTSPSFSYQMTPAAPTDSSAGVWAVPFEQQQQYEQLFHKLDTKNKGVIPSVELFGVLASKYSLSTPVLGRIWELADRDGDDALTPFEFCIAMHLIELKRQGQELPPTVPPSLIASIQQNIKLAQERSLHEKLNELAQQVEKLQADFKAERRRANDFENKYLEALDRQKQLEAELRQKNETIDRLEQQIKDLQLRHSSAFSVGERPRSSAGGRPLSVNSLTRATQGTAATTTTMTTSVQNDPENSFSPTAPSSRSSTGRVTSPHNTEPSPSTSSTTTRPTRTFPTTTNTNRSFVSNDDDDMPMPTKKTGRTSSVGGNVPDPFKVETNKTVPNPFFDE